MQLPASSAGCAFSTVSTTKIARLLFPLISSFLLFSSPIRCNSSVFLKSSIDAVVTRTSLIPRFSKNSSSIASFTSLATCCAASPPCKTYQTVCCPLLLSRVPSFSSFEIVPDFFSSFWRFSSPVFAVFAADRRMFAINAAEPVNATFSSTLIGTVVLLVKVSFSSLSISSFFVIVKPLFFVSSSSFSDSSSCGRSLLRLTHIKASGPAIIARALNGTRNTNATTIHMIVNIASFLLPRFIFFAVVNRFIVVVFIPSVVVI
mmetsp:Transcript_2334/g.8340  ORF Transcript_2334/g.8340 Transcript_2334/m.8340 type:complete len:261 (-) Transcript_2334:149-931(-)